jgi:hypothetical protein
MSKQISNKKDRLVEKETGIDFEKLEDAPYLLDILIQMENVLDSLDIYVYRNWFDGQVVEGPIVRRYWASMSLLYPHDKMPDPRAALRLLKHGVKVEFDRMQRKKADHAPGAKEDKPLSEWMVRLSFPRRLLDQNEEADLEMYDDEVNPDDVEDAKDSGMDNESSLMADEQSGEEMPGQGMPGPGLGAQPLPPGPTG